MNSQSTLFSLQMKKTNTENRTNRLDENGMINFARALGKLVSLKYIEQVITE